MLLNDVYIYFNIMFCEPQNMHNSKERQIGRLGVKFFIIMSDSFLIEFLLSQFS